MNSIDLILIVLALLIVWSGYARGLIVSVLSLVRFAVGIPLSFFVARNYSEAIYNSLFRDTISESIAKNIESSGLDGYISSLNESVSGLPDFLKNSADLSFLNNISSASASQGVMENIVDPVAKIVFEMIIFILTILIFYVITWIIIGFIKKAQNRKNAPFRKTNKFLGAVFGAVKALIVLFSLAAIGNFFVVHAEGTDNGFIRQLASSGIMEFINKFNPILKI